MKKDSNNSSASLKLCAVLSVIPFVFGLGPGFASTAGFLLMYFDTKLNANVLNGQSLLFKGAAGLINIFTYINYPMLPLLPWAVEFLGFAIHSTKITAQIIDDHAKQPEGLQPHPLSQTRESFDDLSGIKEFNARLKKELEESGGSQVSFMSSQPPDWRLPGAILEPPAIRRKQSDNLEQKCPRTT